MADFWKKRIKVLGGSEGLYVKTSKHLFYIGHYD